MIPNNRFIYIHVAQVTSLDDEWRVYHGLLLQTYEQDHCGETCLKGKVLLIGEGDGIHLLDLEHYDTRISAKYWVYSHEFEKLQKDIEEDWERRHCWRIAYEDTQRIKRHLTEIENRKEAANLMDWLSGN